MKCPLLLLILLYSLRTYSQDGYQPGHIIMVDGSTEEGLINLRSAEFNAKKCEFKKNASAETVTYFADDVAAYRFNDGTYFVGRSVSIENSDTILFLECLISGKASIYYTRWNSADYYFLETEGKMVGINNNRADVIRNGVVYNAPSSQYRGVLKHYFRDCASIVQK